MILDINRLHDTATYRGAGNTIKVIAECIGNMLLSKPGELHVIWVPSGRKIDYMIDSVIDVCGAMEVEIREFDRRFKTFLFDGNRKIRVISSPSRDERRREIMRGYYYREFFDY